jgi:hypothetical protein
MVKRMILLALLLGAPALSAPAPRSAKPQVLTCFAPVAKTDTGASLKRRYGAQAVAMDVPGGEGQMVRALVLWPRDKARRLEVFFDDGPMRQLSSVLIRSKGSRWRVAGLGVGATLAEVVRANGGPVTVGGFGWDYGGGVDRRGGKLARLPGGCAVGLTMDIGEGITNPPQGIFGDGVQLPSSDPRLRAARPYVTDIYVSWRE